MPPSVETRPLSPVMDNVNIEDVKPPSPKRTTRTPPKSRPTVEADTIGILERIQGELAEYAKKEVARQVENTHTNMQARLEGQVFAGKDKEYTAPDGTVFQDETKYKKYMYANYYSFKNKEGESITKVSGEKPQPLDSNRRPLNHPSGRVRRHQPGTHHTHCACLTSGDIRGNSFDLECLKGCEVQLLDHTGQAPLRPPNQHPSSQSDTSPLLLLPHQP